MSTNFMHAILEQSFGSDVCVTHNTQCAACDSMEAYEPTPTTYCCWKHGYANSNCSGWFNSDPYPGHVFMERSIYPWLIAMHDQPYDYDGETNDDGSCSSNFSTFIRAPFSYAPDMYPDHTDYAENPIQLWNAKLRSYREFMENVTTAYTTVIYGEPVTRGIRNVSYVNITMDTLYSLDKLQNAMQPLLDDGYILINNQAEITYPPMSLNGTGSEWDLGEFLEAKVYDAQDLWKGLITQEDYDFINSQVDTSIMERAGFEMVYTLNETHFKAASAFTRDEHLQHLRYLDDPRGAGQQLHSPEAARRREYWQRNRASRTAV